MSDDLDILAGEYALGLLEGEARDAAERRLAADPDFADRVARWSGRFSPMLEAIEPAPPPPALWPRIEAAIAESSQASASFETSAGGNVHQLRRRIAMWRGYSVAATALAASLALFLAIRPDTAPAPVSPPAAAPLVAMMSAEGSAARLVATFDPDRRSLVIIPASGLDHVPGRGHQLWLIPADGKPRSMGMVEPGAPRRMAVPPAMLDEMEAEVTLALSVEPAGGSPTGLPTGPVVATGKLHRT